MATAITNPVFLRWLFVFPEILGRYTEGAFEHVIEGANALESALKGDFRKRKTGIAK